MTVATPVVTVVTAGHEHLHSQDVLRVYMRAIFYSPPLPGEELWIFWSQQLAVASEGTKCFLGDVFVRRSGGSIPES